MDGYKHYIRVENGNVTKGFSDAFEQTLETDILYAEDTGRHFQIQMTNERGQYIYKWENEMVERTQTELDTEWDARPIPPDPDVELAEAIEAATTIAELKAALLGNGKIARVKGKIK